MGYDQTIGKYYLIIGWKYFLGGRRQNWLIISKPALIINLKKEIKNSLEETLRF
jgi:hypothetical protein